MWGKGPGDGGVTPRPSSASELLDIHIDILTSPTIRPSYMTAIRSDNARDLIQVFADEQNRRADVALIQKPLVNVLGGADIDAAGRLRRDQHAGVAR